jgi:hypothetical protein
VASTMAGSVGSQRQSNATTRLLTRLVPRSKRCDAIRSLTWAFQLGIFLVVLTASCCVLPSEALSLSSSRSSRSRTRIHATKADINRDASETFKAVDDSIETFESSSPPPPPSPILSAADIRRSDKWEGRFRDLMAFKERYGHTNVPQYPTKAIPEDHRVSANFCRNCRTQYNYHHDPDKQHLSFLTDDRIQRLEEIGFCWNTREATWQLRWKELQAFSKLFGHSNVPARWSENTALAAWVATQRQKYRAQQDDATTDTDNTTATWAVKKYYGKELTQRHIQLLESIGFCWDPHRDHWWMMYEELKDFWQQHNHVKVPRGYAPNPKLPSWIVHQRRYCREYALAVQIECTTDGVTVSGLDYERLEALRAINFFSGLEPERLEALQAMNFCWLPDSKQESNK